MRRLKDISGLSFSDIEPLTKGSYPFMLDAIIEAFVDAKVDPVCSQCPHVQIITKRDTSVFGDLSYVNSLYCSNRHRCPDEPGYDKRLASMKEDDYELEMAVRQALLDSALSDGTDFS